MTPIVPQVAEATPRRTARRRAVPIRTAVVQPPAHESGAALNRRTLQAELLALYDQYRDDVRCADSIETDQIHLADEAADARRDARRRMSLIAELLDSEFPGWEDSATGSTTRAAVRGTAPERGASKT